MPYRELTEWWFFLTHWNFLAVARFASQTPSRQYCIETIGSDMWAYVHICIIHRQNWEFELKKKASSRSPSDKPQPSMSRIACWSKLKSTKPSWYFASSKSTSKLDYDIMPIIILLVNLLFYGHGNVLTFELLSFEHCELLNLQSD